LWSIFDFLMPGFLPPIKKFKNSFIESIDGKIDAQNKLKMFISPFILRRKKNEVLIELPDKQEQIVFCKMAKIQEKIYLQLLEKIKTDYLQQQRDKNYIHLLAALTKLRQICNHPALLEKTMNDDFMLSGKLETLREIVLEAIENDKKILIFSQFVQMLQIIKKLFQKEKIKFEYMDGSTKNRQERIENFNNNNNIRAFLISLKTGGYGLNLTAADTVIIVDPWWNPMTENQAIDRAHRIGQTKKVMIYKLITKNSIEEKIVALQKEKREMFENIIEDGQNVLKKIDVNELQKILEN
ncbi:MAG: DEAD/DEAH box helicase, partial [Candidatus Cloacimonetes bacterium]|nr:DEAD/DEAH box helicase [Candidatus Cloacimonadota bacterium]